MASLSRPARRRVVLTFWHLVEEVDVAGLVTSNMGRWPFSVLELSIWLRKHTH